MKNNNEISFNDIWKAAVDGDLLQLAVYVLKESVELNQHDGEETLFEQIVESLCVVHMRVNGRGIRKPYRYDVVQFLLENGADPNYVGPYSTTAFYGAVHGLDVQMIQLLLDAGADPNIIYYENCPLENPETILDHVDCDTWVFGWPSDMKDLLRNSGAKYWTEIK